MSEDTIKILQRPLSERQVSQSLGPIIAPRGKYPNSKLRRSKSHEEPCGHGAQGQAFSGPREGRNTPPRMESPVPPKKDAKGSGGGASEEVARDILDAIVTAAIEQVKGRESMLEDAICQSVLIEPAEAKEDETILHQSVKRCIKLLQNNDALEKEVKLLQIEMDITNSKKNLEKTKQDIGLKCNTIHKIEEQILSNRRHLKEMKERSLKCEREVLALLDQVNKLERGEVTEDKSKLRSTKERERMTETRRITKHTLGFYKRYETKK